MVQAPPRIDILPEHLIDQIKAGEVIERPGNLIKEILENAVDAGATRLELAVKNNGLDLISLKDDGHGMRLSDLPLAFSRHATSKISRFEDLYRLRTFGFRGEALASIAAIAKVQCLTKTTDSKTGAELRIEGGLTVYHGERNPSFEHGTELVIQDLFFNTPARLKFIQSQQSEKQFIKRVIFAFVLSHPEIEFLIKLEEGEKEIFPRRDSLLERIQDIFPKAKGAILSSERFYENNELRLHLVPDAFKGPVKIQNILINGRYILDKQLHRVMTQSLESTFGEASFHYIAEFFLPPDTIDVNVHPNKTIIKCLETSKMISLLTSTVKELGVKKPRTEVPSSAPETPPASFFIPHEEAPVLQQERHHYNMEGFFSPHRLPDARETDFLWLENYFLKQREGSWIAVSGTKLLEVYTKKNLEKTSTTIPLLVSEPFPASKIDRAALELLTQAGAELEYLNTETLVLRGIPDWMNGFPLKDVITCLLQNKPFSELVIDPRDWSQSTWEEMLESFSASELLSHKISIELVKLLKEKLK
jgi:DNA mismatch repair protein MutL